MKICKIRKVKTPVRAHATDAGIDFFVPENLLIKDLKEKNTSCPQLEYIPNQNSPSFCDEIVLKPGDSVLIPSGIKADVPAGHALIFHNKSGVGSKKQLDILASVVDESYQGEIHINLVNNGNNWQTIKAGDKIVQGIIMPINQEMVEEVPDEEALYGGVETDRGSGGFGSSGS